MANQKNQRPGKVDSNKEPSEKPMAQPDVSGELEGDDGGRLPQSGRGAEPEHKETGSVISNDDEVALDDEEELRDEEDDEGNRVTGRHPSQVDRDLK